MDEIRMLRNKLQLLLEIRHYDKAFIYVKKRKGAMLSHGACEAIG
jgi:hypothetical protein